MSTQTKLKQITAGLRGLHPELVQAGRWLYVTPVFHVLTGILLDGSGDKTVFRPTSFFVPLYSPENVHPSWRNGSRLGRSVKYDDPDVSMKLADLFNEHVASLLPGITQIDKLLEYVKSARPWHGGSYRPGPHEAYTLAALGKFDEARQTIEGFVAELRGGSPPPRWREDIERFRLAIDRGSDEVIAHLHEIEKRNALSLNVESHWHPTPFPFETNKS